MVAQSAVERTGLMGFFRPTYTVFAGENTWSECFWALRRLFVGVDDTDAVHRFEAEFARVIGRRHAVSFGAGRMALYAILRALEIEPGDEVVLQAFTCNVVPRAIRAASAVPVYVDIEPADFNMDLSKLRAAVTPRTRAIIVQHSFGIPMSIFDVQAIVGDRNIAIIEDCAHAFRPATRGDAGNGPGFVFFSTDHTKPLNTHVGGLAATDSDQHAAVLRQIESEARTLGRIQRKRLEVSFLAEFVCHRPRAYPILRFVMAAFVRSRLFFVWPDAHKIAHGGDPTGLYRMTSFQAVLGLSQLQRLDVNTSHRRMMFDMLQQRIGWYRTNVAVPVLRYAFLVADRPSFLRQLGDGIAKSTWFDAPVSCGRASYAEVGYQEGSCPVAEEVARHVVNIPISSKMPTSLLRQFDRFDRRELVHPADIAGVSAAAS